MDESKARLVSKVVSLCIGGFLAVIEAYRIIVEHVDWNPVLLGVILVLLGYPPGSLLDAKRSNGGNEK